MSAWVSPAPSAFFTASSWAVNAACRLRSSADGVVIRASRLDAERDDRNDEAASTGLFVAALDFVITYEEEA